MATPLTVREVAVRVGRTEETVRRWIWSGRLRASKRGNILYVLPSDLPDMSGTADRRRDRPRSGLSQPALTLAEWAGQVDAWRATTGPSTGSAADLVIEDRMTRDVLDRAAVDGR